MMGLCAGIAAVAFSFFSVHTNPEAEKKYDETNPGVHAQCNDNVVFGIYENSYSKVSVYAGYEYKFNKYFGIQAQLTTGYNSPIAGGFTVNPHKNLKLIVVPDPRGQVIFSALFRYNL